MDTIKTFTVSSLARKQTPNESDLLLISEKSGEKYLTKSTSIGDISDSIKSAILTALAPNIQKLVEDILTEDYLKQKILEVIAEKHDEVWDVLDGDIDGQLIINAS